MANISKFSNRLLSKGGHTVIMGWSALGLQVVRELTEANRNVRKPRILIISTEAIEKVESDLSSLNLGRQKFQIYQVAKDQLKQQAEELGQKARAVIDLQKSHAKLIKQIEERCSRSSTLTLAVDELLSFIGDEIYFQELPALFGKTYADAVLAFNTASVLGVVIDGKVILNPEPTFLLPAESKVVAIAEDDDKVIYSGIREDALAKLNLKLKRSAIKELQDGNKTQVGIENLKAKLLSQIAENPALQNVYSELFSQGGKTIFVVPIASFSTLGEETEFAELSVAAISRGYSAIGYATEDSQIILNPAKTQSFTAKKGDGLVVIGNLN